MTMNNNFDYLTEFTFLLFSVTFCKNCWTTIQKKMVVCPRATKQGQIKEDLLNLPVTKLQRKMLNQAVVPDHVDHDQMLNEGVRGGAGAVKSCCLC